MSFLVCGLVVFGISGRRLSQVLPQRFAGLVQGVAHGGYLADGIEHAVVVDEIFVAHDGYIHAGGVEMPGRILVLPDGCPRGNTNPNRPP